MTPIPHLDQLTMATTRAVQGSAQQLQDGALLAAGAGVLALGARYVARLVKADGEQQTAMHRRIEQLEAAEDEREHTINLLANNVSELHAQWRACEKHREEQAQAVQRLEATLQDLQRRLDNPGTH